jgi:hypothetical protein
MMERIDESENDPNDDEVNDDVDQIHGFCCPLLSIWYWFVGRGNG